MSKKLRPINDVNVFTCCGKEMSYKDFKEHLLTVHKLDIKANLKAKKSMLMHIDGDKWFSYYWQWELENGLKFTQYTQQARSKDSMMF